MLQQLYDKCVKPSIRECRGQTHYGPSVAPNQLDETLRNINEHLGAIDAEQRIQNSEIQTLKCGNFQNVKISDTLKVDNIQSFSNACIKFLDPVNISDLTVENLHIECFCADDAAKFAGLSCVEWKEIINCSCVDDTNKFAGFNCIEWKYIVSETYVNKAKDSDCFSGLTCTGWKEIIKTTYVDNAANATKFDNKTYAEVCEDILAHVPPQPYSGEIDVYCGDACLCTINCDNPLVLFPNAFNENAKIDTDTYPGACCVGTVTSVNNIAPVNGNVTLPLPPDLSSCPGLDCIGDVVQSDIQDFITMNDVDECGYTTCIGTVTSVKTCLNGCESNAVTGSGTLSLNITPSLCFDTNSRKICNILGNKTSNEITLPSGINCVGTVVQSDIANFITMSEVDACGYTTCLGTVTSVNNITPVNGNVTLALPPDLSSDVTCLRNDVDAIESKIPTQASTTNQLADKDFVNSSIETATATFVGTFDDVSCLPTTGVDNNDYAFVTTCDSQTGTVSYTRYKYSDYTHTWICEYTINTTGFTAEQLAALNSGITDTLVAKITDVYNPTICIYSNGTCCGSFTLNQSSNKCIGICNDKVVQTLLDTSANRPLLFASASITSGACCGVYYNTNITANSNTGVINAALNGVACRAKCNCVITTTCNCTFYPVFSPNNTSSYKYNYTNANLSYNPSTGTLTALCFNGAAKDSTCFAGCTYACAKADMRDGLVTTTDLNSCGYTTCVGTVTSVNVCLNGTNATAITTSGKMCLNLTPSLSYTTSTRALTTTLGNKTSTAITLPEGINCTGTLVPSDLNGYATEAWVTAKNYCTHDCLVKHSKLTSSAASVDRNILIMGNGYVDGCVCPVWFSDNCKLTFNPLNGNLKSGNFVYNKGGCTSRNIVYNSINYTGTRCTAMDIKDFLECFSKCHSLSAGENLTVKYTWADANNNCVCWGTSSVINLSGASASIINNNYSSTLWNSACSGWFDFSVIINSRNGTSWTFGVYKGSNTPAAPTIYCNSIYPSRAGTANNSTCFGGKDYSTAYTDIRTGLVTSTDLNSCGYTTCIGTVTGVSLNGCSFTLGTDGVASLTDFKPATAGTADNSTCFNGCTYAQACTNIRSGLCSHDCLVKLSLLCSNSDRAILQTGAGFISGCICPVYASSGVPFTYNACCGCLKIGDFTCACCDRVLIRNLSGLIRSGSKGSQTNGFVVYKENNCLDNCSIGVGIGSGDVNRGFFDYCKASETATSPTFRWLQYWDAEKENHALPIWGELGANNKVVYSCVAPSVSNTKRYVLVCFDKTCCGNPSSTSACFEVDIYTSKYNIWIDAGGSPTTAIMRTYWQNNGIDPNSSIYGGFCTALPDATANGNCFWIAYGGYRAPVIKSSRKISIICNTTTAPSGITFTAPTNRNSYTNVYCGATCVCTLQGPSNLCLSANAFNTNAQISTTTYPGACCTGTLVASDLDGYATEAWVNNKGYTTCTGTVTGGSFNGKAGTVSNGCLSFASVDFNYICNAVSQQVAAGTTTRKSIVTNQITNVGYVSRAAIGLYRCSQWGTLLLSLGVKDDGTCWTDYCFCCDGTIKSAKCGTAQNIHIVGYSDNSTCFGGCTYSQACTDIRNGLCDHDCLVEYVCCCFDHKYPLLFAGNASPTSGCCYGVGFSCGNYTSYFEPSTGTFSTCCIKVGNPVISTASQTGKSGTYYTDTGIKVYGMSSPFIEFHAGSSDCYSMRLFQAKCALALRVTNAYGCDACTTEKYFTFCANGYLYGCVCGNLCGTASSAVNSTCFGGCTYAQACTNIRSGLVTTTALNSCGYATETWVENKGYTTCTGTLVPSDLNGYATETWVTNKGYTTCTGTISSISLNGNAFTVSNGAATLTGFKPATAVLADCATRIKRNQAPSGTYYLPLFNGKTAVDNACIYVSCECDVTYGTATGTLSSPSYYATSYVRTPTLMSEAISGASKVGNVVIRACCTNASCALTCRNFTFCGSTGRMHGNVCGNLYGNATNSCLVCRYTINTGVQHVLLGANCTASASTCVRVSNGCPLTFDPETGTLCTCTICGTVCGSIELAPEHIEYQYGGSLDIYNIGALTVIKAKCALSCDMAKCLWKYRETSYIGICAQYVGVTGTYVRRGTEVLTNLVDNLYFSCANGVCCVQLRKINNQIVTFRSDCDAYGEWWIGLSIPILG